MRYSQERGSWYLITGLVLGAVLGILYTRYFQPVQYVDNAPAVLRQDAKDQYRALIAAAYLANGDLVRARARLDLLQDADPLRALTEQAQRTLAQQGASNEARALGLLAIALGQQAPGPGQVITQVLPAATGEIPVSTALSETSLAPLQEPRSSPEGSEATAVLPAPTLALESLALLAQEQVCEQPLPAPLIQVEVVDLAGNPLPGALIIINWAGGEERFFTGLKSEKGAGYADFTLSPDFIYSLRLGENGLPIGNLGAVRCQGADGSVFWGSLSLKFGQP